MNATTVLPKATIQGSFRSKSTLRTYQTYQNQFSKFCKDVLAINPAGATPVACIVFFHHLYSLGKTARTVDSAKTALVAYFQALKVDPNPARDVEAKQYVAHPLSVYELSLLENSLASSHMFVGALYGFLLCASYIGCFRISEMLN
ncbi:hypothetical protein H257_17869 [Aphanomyces astaci]|uniref:Core-binding (CB) domain-containing protein n=1 Tax=Aphanomyces astaci TaxID=112090 RepID=W4FF93_APHAT|nr:hypothetical protein H257_17869 [Aphanomyces astaci]ETV65408.1 hypothetical protein H257_17869 [Aphanomyces astaci]|eukprot:XP_009845123.1 hypothetical protein H257_17869 [Aphanomyces astaci]